MHIYKCVYYVTMMVIIKILARHRVHCSPALPPSLFQLEAMSGVVAPATAGLLALCITFIKPTLPYVVHTNMHMHICTCKGETSWNLRRLPIPIPRVVNDSFYIHRQSKDLLQRTLTSIFLMHVRMLYHVSLLINYNLRYK